MAVKGDVDGVHAKGLIWGWALDTDFPNETQFVKIVIGAYAFEVRADVHRPDIAGSFGSHGKHGFVFTPPPSIPPGRYFVDIVCIPSNTPLSNGRFELKLADDAAGGIGARAVGGGPLAPGRPQQMDMAALRPKSGNIRHIDNLVASGRITEAYLKARFAVHDGGPPSVHRFLALDFVLRTGWHNYEPFLAGFHDKAARSFIDDLTGAYRQRAINGTPVDADLPAKGGLPAELYAPLFTRALPPGRPFSPSALFEPNALSLTLPQLPLIEDLQSQYDKLVVIVAAPQKDEASIALEQLQALGALVLTLEGGAASAEPLAAEIAAAAPGRGCFVVLRESRILPIQAAGYWPVLARRSGPALASLLQLGPDPVTIHQLNLIGRIQDPATAICTDVATAARFAAGEPIDATFLPAEFMVCDHISHETAHPTCVVIHDFDAHNAPAAPSGGRIIAAAGTAGDDVFAPAWLEIARAGLPPATPVIFMSRLYQYPAGYIARLLHEFFMAADRSVVTSHLTYSPDQGGFGLSAAADGSPVFLGLRERGCYRLSDLMASGERFPPMEDSRIVVATNNPFKLVSEGDSSVAWTNDAAATPTLRTLAGSLMSREKGFNGTVMASWAGAAEACAMPSIPLTGDDLVLVPVLALGVEAAKAWIDEPLFYRKLQEVARRGHHDVVQNFIREHVTRQSGVLKLSDESLLGLLECCKVLGLQEYFNTKLYPYLPTLLNRSPSVVIPLAENMAMSLAPPDLTAALMAGAALILEGNSAQSVTRLVSACRRYCSGHAMVILVGMIRRSAHGDVLKDPSVAEVVGSALMTATPSYLLMSDDAGEPTGMLFTAPLLERILAALLSGDGPLFIRLLNHYFNERQNILQILLRLRTYTYEITLLGIKPNDIRYPGHATLKEKLALAILMDDRAAIRQFDGAGTDHLASTDDAHGIVAASYHRNMRPLESAIARLGRPYGIAPIHFAGETIEQLFGNFASQPVPPEAAEDHGRVSIILTVYNPDLPLLVRALQSLIRQTYRNIEILLLDDASDLVASREIEALAGMDPRIVFVKMPRNVGPYVGRNRALEIATGAFIAIHDGDDYAHPQRIEAQVRSLSRSPVLKLSTACHLRIDQLARLQFEHTLDILGDGTMTSMFRRDVFDVLGGFAPVRSRGDVEFRERMKAVYGEHVHEHLQCPLTFCFATPGSLSNSVTRILPDYLALFREAFAKRIRIPVLQGRRVAEGTDQVVIPWPLRSENPLF